MRSQINSHFPVTVYVRVCLQSESLSSERKYLLTRVSQLSCELEDAHKTIAALENINVSAAASTGHLCTRHHRENLM